jgi:hypothetical protein
MIKLNPFLFYFSHFKEKFRLLAQFFLFNMDKDDKQGQLLSFLTAIKILSK